MNTNQAVIDFCTDYEDYTTIYTLKRWEKQSIAAFAQCKLRKEKSREFISRVNANQNLLQLASLPFYCDMLVEQFRDHGFRDTHSAVDLVDRALKDIIKREYEKGLALNEKVMPVDDVLSFAQDIAQRDIQEGSNGIPVSTISDLARDWAELVWEDPGAGEERERFVIQMCQIALFAQDPSTGRLRFVQEILEQYLLGRLYVDYFRKGAISRFIDEFNYWEFPEDSLTLELLSAYCTTEMSGLNDMQSLVHEALRKPKTFRNMMQLLSVMGFDGSFLKQSVVGRDLSNLKLRQMDLTGVSFSGCDLTNTEFHKCKLQNANFSSAIISNTGFFGMDHELMNGAILEDMAKFHSMRVDTRRTIVRSTEAKVWWNETTASEEMVSELPCDTAEQLKVLFGKFVRPDGRGRRDDCQEKDLNRGRRYILRPEMITTAAIKYLYLSRSNPNKYRRADGDRYGEMVEFVKQFQLSPGLRFLLDDVCDIEECPHVDA